MNAYFSTPDPRHLWGQSATHPDVQLPHTLGKWRASQSVLGAVRGVMCAKKRKKFAHTNNQFKCQGKTLTMRPRCSNMNGNLHLTQKSKKASFYADLHIQSDIF
jgi:hypothetical protein